MFIFLWTGRSKYKAAEAIAGVLALEKTLESHQSIVRELEHQLISNSVDDITTFNLQLNDARARCAKVAETHVRRRAGLGISESADLQKLKKNVYLQVRMNAHALKIRLRNRLRQRKFELEKLERSYRNTVNGTFNYPLLILIIHTVIELNLRSHTETSIKRREPTILKIVSTYNTLCDQLHALIRQRKAPTGAIPPQHISRNGIFQLDVDDDVWQDIGLEDDIADPPQWLSDENVRQGIRLLLDLDRCLEEEGRLRRERCIMQEYMVMEWTALQRAREVASELLTQSLLYMRSNVCIPIDADVAWHLERRATQLSLISVEWQSRVRPIPCAWGMPDSWGPSAVDMARAAHSLYHAKTAHATNSDSLESSEDEGEDSDLDEGDDELMAAMEEANEYWIVDSDSEGDLEGWDETHVPSSPTLY
jgi:hypothetical protein